MLRNRIKGVKQIYLGLGTFSSGTGVQVESGDFCSLKRPVKASAISAMSYAQTAEPGILKHTFITETRFQPK